MTTKRLADLNDDELRVMIGDPARFDAELHSFQESHRLLSQMYPELVKLHPKEWVAMAAGNIKAHAISLEALLRLTDEQGLPRRSLVIEYLDPDPPRLFL